MRQILTGIAITALVTGLCMVRPEAVANLDDSVCDMLAGWAGHGKPSGKVVIVEIDEASLAAFGRWPWPRDLLGSIVGRILEGGAATVVLDAVFDATDSNAPSPQTTGVGKRLQNHAAEPAGKTNDDVLADVVRGHPVAAGYAFRFDAEPSPTCELPSLPVALSGPQETAGKGLFHATGALCTVAPVSAALAGAGFLNGTPDRDGKMRVVPLVMEYRERQYPSIALAAFAVYRHLPAMQLRLSAIEASWLRIGAQMIPLEGQSSMRLRFRGQHGSFPYISAAGVSNGSVPRETFRDKVVIIGGTGLGLPNPVATPIDPEFPDVEIQATAIDNLLQGDSFQKPWTMNLSALLLAVIAGISATLLLERARAWESAVVILGGVLAAWAGCAWLVSETGLLLSPLPVSAVLACSFPVLTLLNYQREKQRTALTERQLETERVTAQETLQESESRYRRLVENINDAIVVTDKEGRIVFANSRFEQWFGRGGRNVLGTFLDDFVAPEWRDRVRDHRERRLSGEAVSNICEYESLREDATRMWIEALDTDVIEDGRVAGIQSALRDVTQRRQISARSLQAQKMENIGRLAGGVAHDFNNMLQVINGYAEQLLQEVPDDGRSRRGLQAIQRAAERAAELTRKLLYFSRKEVSRPALLDLNELVVESGRMYGRLLGDDIEVVTKLSPALGAVMADSGQIHQILMNLLVNARDAMPGGGQIIVETRNLEEQGAEAEPSRWVSLQVTDQGCGMNDEVKRHLFEPFFTTKDPGEGTGLGLATVYGIVTQSAGRIEVDSAEGKGSTFHIRFPLAEGEAVKQAETSAAAARRGSETILLVEDQDSVRKYLCDALENLGYHVLEAANGAEALRLAQESDSAIDLVISDLVMPQMSGIAMAEHMRKQKPQMNFLFISGFAKGLLNGQNLVYLQKPFSIEQLSKRIEEILRQPSEDQGMPMAAGA